jgi:hypothetical protein
MVLKLVQEIAHFDSTSQSSLNHLLGAIDKLKRLAIESDCPPVAKAIMSLETYLRAMGLNGKLLKSLLREHLECIALLSDPDAVSEEASHGMIKDLRLRVSKNMKAVHKA